MLGFYEQEAISLHINLGQCEQLQGFYLQKIKIWLGLKVLADNIMIPAPFLSQSKLNGEEYPGILNCLFGNVIFLGLSEQVRRNFFIRGNLVQCEELQWFFLQKINVWLEWNVLAGITTIPTPFLSRSKLNREGYPGILHCLSGNNKEITKASTFDVIWSVRNSNVLFDDVIWSVRNSNVLFDDVIWSVRNGNVLFDEYTIEISNKKFCNPFRPDSWAKREN